MKKGQVYEATVERVDFPGKGVMHVGEHTVIVKNCLPGQKISFRVDKVKNGRAEGRLLEVLEHAPLEDDRTCSHFGMCGGCTYLPLPYEEQLKLKEQQVKRLLDTCMDRQEEAWTWEGIKGSPAAYGYRNKMEFSFGDEVKDGPLALGMHRRGSFYDVVTVDGCRIVDGDYRLILRAALDYFAVGGASGKRVGYFHRMHHEGYLRHLLVRKASRTGEILAALVTTSQDPWGRGDGVMRDDMARCGVMRDGMTQKGAACDGMAQDGMKEEALMEGFRECLLDLERGGRLQGRFAGILHIVNDTLADVVQSDRTDVLSGRDYFYEELLGLKFKISVFSFFQTNTLGAEVLYRTVREYVGDLGSGGADGGESFGGGSSDDRNFGGGAGRVVFDLYSGTGTIAQLMAPVADKVIGVEIVEEAVHAARKNAEENGLENCEFIAGDVLKVLDTLEEKPDLIILDPPRDGIHPKALPKIGARSGAERIVYISCKPTSLVRDLAVLMGYGYRVERGCCVDMFPGTGQIETICSLSKLHADLGG